MERDKGLLDEARRAAKICPDDLSGLLRRIDGAIVRLDGPGGIHLWRANRFRFRMAADEADAAGDDEGYKKNLVEMSAFDRRISDGEAELSGLREARREIMEKYFAPPEIMACPHCGGRGTVEVHHEK